MTDDIPDQIDDVIERTKKKDPGFEYWLPVDVNMYEHRKVRRLAAHLDIPRPYALGLVITFLSKVFKFATPGDIVGDNTQEITFWSEYPGDRDFTKAMVDAGFLDVIDGGYRVHKWSQRMERFLKNLARRTRKKSKDANRQRGRRKGMAYERAGRAYGEAPGYLRRPPKTTPEIVSQTPPENSALSDHVAGVNGQNGATDQKEGIALNPTDIPVSTQNGDSQSYKVLHEFDPKKPPLRNGHDSKNGPPILVKIKDIPASHTCSTHVARVACTEQNRTAKEEAAGRKHEIRPAKPSSFSNKKPGRKEALEEHREIVDLWFVLYKARLGESCTEERGFVDAVVSRISKAGATRTEVKRRMAFWFKTEIPWTKRMRWRLDRFEKKFGELAAGPLAPYQETRRQHGGLDKPKGDERTIPDF